MMKYHTIVFAQVDGHDETFTAVFDRDDPDEIKQYLEQWDYGEYHDEPTEEPWGTSDTCYTFGRYVLSVNRGLGYAALQVESENT
jgi:hypothetical protein